MDNKTKQNLDLLSETAPEMELDTPLSGKVEKEKPPTLTSEAAEKEKRGYAYKIFVYCAIILCLVLIADNIASIGINKVPSPLNTTAIDLVKTVVLLALGYLFNKTTSS